MVTFKIYSNDTDPDRLYRRNCSPATSSPRVEQLVGIGDRPLDLVINVRRRHILWTFIGEHRADDTRAGYFIAAYLATSSDLFRGFEGALQSLQFSGDWALPHSDDLRCDAGFQLWRVTPDLPGLTKQERKRLFEHLRSGGDYLEFRMGSYRHAMQAAKAVYTEDLPCTVAVDGEQRDDIPEDVDILFRPTGDTDFEPVSKAATQVLTPPSTTAGAKGVTDGGSTTFARLSPWKLDQLLIPLGGIALLGMLLFALYSFISPQPVHPITGLATIGGFVGALLAFPGMATLTFRKDEGATGDTVVGASFRALRKQRALSLSVVTYGTVMAFIYPTLFRVAGSMFGSSWVFGPILELSAALLSVVVFTVLLLGGTWLFAELIAKREIGRERAVHLVTGHIVYATLILVATGFASTVWYQFIPAA